MTSESSSHRGTAASVPLVSVVLSVFDGERDLPAALASLLAEREVDLEVVAVDDGSRDGSGRMLDEQAVRDPRLRVIHQPNTGLTKALIRGCREARGRFIARQDVDDLSLRGRLALQSRRLLSNDALAFVSCGVAVIGPRGEFLRETAGPEDPDDATRALMLDHRGPVHGSVMFRRDAYEKVGGYREEYYFAQDSDLWLRLGEVGRISWLPQVLYALKISATALSGRWSRAQLRLGEISHMCQAARSEGRSEAEYLREARTLRPGSAVPDPADLAATEWFLARSLLGRGDRRGLPYARSFTKARPRDPKGWASLAWGALTAWRMADPAWLREVVR